MNNQERMSPDKQHCCGCKGCTHVYDFGSDYRDIMRAPDIRPLEYWPYHHKKLCNLHLLVDLSEHVSR